VLFNLKTNRRSHRLKDPEKKKKRGARFQLSHRLPSKRKKKEKRGKPPFFTSSLPSERTQ